MNKIMIRKKKLKFIQITLILLGLIIIFLLIQKFSKRSGQEILVKMQKLK